VTALVQEESPTERQSTLLPLVEAVAQTPREAAGSFLSVGSEIAHLVCRERPVHREVVPHIGSGVHFRERAARFLRRLYATASVRSDSVLGMERDASCPDRCSGRRAAAGRSLR
jgi:hypothetical protein